MRIVEVMDRNSSLVKELLKVWESSVTATHLFLSEDEIAEIKEYVPQALEAIPHLIIVENDNKIPVGFMGISKQHLEMLFVANDQRNQGLGKALLQYGMEKYFVNDLAVNEQNVRARGFYEHMEFEVYQRNELDDQEKPYPVLYMKRKNDN